MRAQTYEGRSYPKIEVCIFMYSVAGKVGQIRETKFVVRELEKGKGVGDGKIYFTPRGHPPGGPQKIWPYKTTNLSYGQTTAWSCTTYSGRTAVNTDNPCGFYPGPDTASAGYPEQTKVDFVAIRTDIGMTKTIDSLTSTSFKI